MVIVIVSFYFMFFVSWLCAIKQVCSPDGIQLNVHAQRSIVAVLVLSFPILSIYDKITQAFFKSCFSFTIFLLLVMFIYTVCFGIWCFYKAG